MSEKPTEDDCITIADVLRALRGRAGLTLLAMAQLMAAALGVVGYVGAPVVIALGVNDGASPILLRRHRKTCRKLKRLSTP